MGELRDIDLVNDLFGSVMSDPKLDVHHGLLSAISAPHRTTTRRATLKLPDLHTVIVTQNKKRSNSIVSHMLTSPREALLEHEIMVARGLRDKRREEVALYIKYLGIAIDMDDIRHDKDAVEELREELKLPSTLDIIGVFEVDDIPTIQPNNFYFDASGRLIEDTQAEQFKECLITLGGCVMSSITEPQLTGHMLH